jgi:hypothetical protein
MYYRHKRLDIIYFLNIFFVRKHRFPYSYRYFSQGHRLNSIGEYSSSLEMLPWSEIVGEEQKESPRTQLIPD